MNTSNDDTNNQKINYLALLFGLTLSSLNVGCTKNNCVETLKFDCICDTHYEPVCGCNGKTYGNACEANCVGITEFTTGECPQ